MGQKPPQRALFSIKAEKNMFFLKKNPPTFCCFKKKLYLCIAIEKNNGSIAQLNRAFDYGSKGYRFESYWSHSEAREGQSHDWPSFFAYPPSPFTIHHSTINIQHSTKKREAPRRRLPYSIQLYRNQLFGQLAIANTLGLFASEAHLLVGLILTV